MSATVARHRSGPDADRSIGRPSPAGSRAAGPARTLCTPTNGLGATAAILGWLALVAWTGVGPAGWQARACSGLDLRPVSCAAVPARKDESRIAPHVPAVRSPA